MIMKLSKEDKETMIYLMKHVAVVAILFTCVATTLTLIKL